MTHGTRYGYRRARCRCDKCRNWHRLDTARQKGRRATRPVAGVHGLAATYENWACRCELCKRAKAVKNLR